MYLDSAKKEEIFEKYGKSKADTGSAESQIALFTYRISHLTEHMKANHKDFNTSRALKMLVGKRRRLLDYLIKVDIERYRAISRCSSAPYTFKRVRFPQRGARLFCCPTISSPRPPRFLCEGGGRGLDASYI